MHSLTTDPLLWTPEDYRLDLMVGDPVVVGSDAEHLAGTARRGIVTGLCSDRMYPVRVLLNGDTREMRPIGNSIKRPGEL